MKSEGVAFLFSTSPILCILEYAGFRSPPSDGTETVRIQLLPDLCGSLKEKARSIIYKYCNTIEMTFQKIDPTVTLNNYLSIDLVRLKEDDNVTMTMSNATNSNRFERWKEVGETFNEYELIRQITAENNTDVMKQYLIEASL